MTVWTPATAAPQSKPIWTRASTWASVPLLPHSSMGDSWVAPCRCFSGGHWLMTNWRASHASDRPKEKNRQRRTASAESSLFGGRRRRRRPLHPQRFGALTVLERDVLDLGSL